MCKIAHAFGVSTATVSRVVAKADDSPTRGKRITSAPRRRKIAGQLVIREQSIAVLQMALATCRAAIAQIEAADPKASPVLDDLDYIATDIAEHIETLWDSTVTILDGNGMAL